MLNYGMNVEKSEYEEWNGWLSIVVLLWINEPNKLYARGDHYKVIAKVVWDKVSSRALNSCTSVLSFHTQAISDEIQILIKGVVSWVSVIRRQRCIEKCHVRNQEASASRRLIKYYNYGNFDP